MWATKFLQLMMNPCDATTSELHTTSIFALHSFTLDRGTNHALALTLSGSTCTVSLDGLQVYHGRAEMRPFHQLQQHACLHHRSWVPVQDHP